MTGAPHWRPAYVGLGSNLHGPAQQLATALDHLGSIEETRLINRSSLYRSAPLGGIEQADFVNATAALLTTLNARQLLDALRTIEARRGRERGELRWGPRIIDLDLLVYSDATIDEDGLQVPHPGIGQRNFVLLPLMEIAPGLVIPGLGPLARIPVNHDEPRIERIV